MSAGSFAGPRVQERVDLAAREGDLVLVGPGDHDADDGAGDDEERHEEDRAHASSGASLAHCDRPCGLRRRPARIPRSTRPGARGRRWNTFYRPSSRSRGGQMYVGLSKEQEALRDELRAVLRQPAHARGRRRPAQGRRRRPGLEGRLEADVQGRLGRRRLAEGVGRPGHDPDRAVRLLRRVDALRRAGADAHDQLGRADDHALRLRGAEAVLRRQDPEGRDPLRDRLHRARRGHRPRVAEDQSRARRRRVHHQRAEGVHEPRERLRLHLARGAHEHTRPRSTRASRSSSCPPTRPASRTSRSTTSATRTRTSRTTKTCACRSATSSARRTRAGRSSPTS